MGLGMAIKTIKGNSNNNSLTGTSGQDYIYGYAGNDTISGGAGADTVDGGLGHDALYGGLGNDVLLGGEGNDALSGDSGNDTLDGGAGTDTAQFSGPRSAYTVTALNATTLLVSGADGTKTVRNTELFNFGGTVVALADLIPNLAAGALSLSAGSLAPGGALSVSFGVQSSGSLAVPAVVSFELRNVVTGAVTVVSQQDLGVLGGSAAALASLDIAALGLAPGAYQMRGVIDRAGLVTESIETDNASAWANFSVQAPVVQMALAPLTLGSASDYDKNGDAQVVVGLTLSHSGNTGAGSHMVGLRLVHDGQVVPLGSVAITVALNGTATVNHVIAVPAGYDAGTWQLEAELLPDANLPSAAITSGVQQVGFSLFGADDYGTAGADLMAGSAVADVLHLAAGDDTMVASLGNDVAHGGDGVDLADYAGFSVPIQAQLDEATGQVSVGLADGSDFVQTLNGFERFKGTSGDDVFIFFGGPASAGYQVDAGAGNDGLIGSAGNDTLSGGAGDDFFDAAAGHDTVVLGSGADRIGLLYDPGTPASGTSRVLDFDAAEDLIYIGYEGVANQPASGMQFVTQTAEGALVDLGDGNWILLAGTLAASLSEACFVFEDILAYQ